MAVYEYEFTAVRSQPFSDASVGALQWFGGAGTIRGVQAKLSSGSGTFNLGTDSGTGQLTSEEGLPDRLWYFRSDDLSLDHDDDDPVTNWYSFDSSLSTATAAGTARPLYKDNASPGGDTHGVHFDGVNDFLTVSSGFTDFEKTTGFSIAVVLGDDISPTGSPDQIPIIGTYNSLLVGTASLYGRAHRMLFRNDAGGVKQSSSLVADKEQVRVAVYDGTSVGSEVTHEWVLGEESYKDASLSGSIEDFTLNSIGAIATSSLDEYLDGDISEIIVFDGVLDDTQRQLVEGMLAWRWGLEDDLVGPDGSDDHPYRTSQGNPLSFDYALGTDIELDTTYSAAVNPTITVKNTDIIRFYTPLVQNPGTLTIQLTFLAD